MKSLERKGSTPSYSKFLADSLVVVGLFEVDRRYVVPVHDASAGEDRDTADVIVSQEDAVLVKSRHNGLIDQFRRFESVAEVVGNDVDVEPFLDI